MKVVINGREKDLPKEISVSELLKILNIDQNKSVVELNREIISDYNIIVKDGDILEIIRMVGGG